MMSGCAGRINSRKLWVSNPIKRPNSSFQLILCYGIMECVREDEKMAEVGCGGGMMDKSEIKG